VYAGGVALWYGAYLGILVHQHYYGWMWLDMFKTKFTMFFYRLFIMLVLALPFGLPFILVPWTAPLTVLILFKTLLPSFLVGIVIFGFAHYFFARFSLLKPDS
jgi:hypothetical protein